MKKILVTLNPDLLTQNHKSMLAEAAGENAELTYVNVSDVTEDMIRQFDGLIGNPDPSLIAVSDLQWIQLHSAGADKYLAPGILPEGCVLKNAVGAYGRAVSEHMLSLTMALVRKLPAYIRNQAEHSWKDEGRVTSVEGSCVLVLGLGDIGGSYARKVKALGAYVIGVRASDKPKPDYLDEQYTMEHLPQLLGRADIVASVLPSTPETRGLFSSDTFAKFKEGAYFINAGRGDACDLADLKDALDSGHLAGAGLDVTAPEPLNADHPLWDYPNVIITPHVAGGFHLQQTFDRIVELAAAHMKEWLEEA